MSKPMDEQRYTYADYVTWTGDERWELIDGAAHLMSPGPSMDHQKILVQLSGLLWTALRGKPCTLYVAPMDVTFEEAEDTSTVVQPDLFVMCGEFRHGKRVIDVPALIVEILSPSTARKDRVTKRALYERVGVKEYWIVDGANETVDVLRYDEGQHYEGPQIYGFGDTIQSVALPDLSVEVELIFGEKIE